MHLAPVVPAFRLMVRQLQGQPRFVRNPQRLLHAFNQIIALAAQVRRVEAAVLRGDLRQLDNLFRLGEAVGRVLQPCGEGDRARLKTLRNLAAHRVQLGGGGRSLLVAHYLLTRRAVPTLRHIVRAQPQLVQLA